MKTLKDILRLLCFLAILAIVFGAGIEYQKRQPISKILKQVQIRIGCTMIDGKVWGPESKGLLKPIIEEEEKELFNSYASVFMTESGKPK